MWVQQQQQRKPESVPAQLQAADAFVLGLELVVHDDGYKDPSHVVPAPLEVVQVAYPTLAGLV